MLYKINYIKIERKKILKYLIWGLASNVILGLACTGGGFDGIDVCDGFAMRLGGALNTLGGCWRLTFDEFGGGTLGGNGGRILGGIRTPKKKGTKN